MKTRPRDDYASTTICISPRQSADFLLFLITFLELAALLLISDFVAEDWLYIAAHLAVLVISLTRPIPSRIDRSWLTSMAVSVSYAYPYAQVVYLRAAPGDMVLPDVGLALVALSALLGLLSLFFLGRSFGVRPALRSLVTNGPYRFVRHPMYLAYVIGDVGYNLEEYNVVTILLTFTGWISLIFRARAEEVVLSKACGWPAYSRAVRFRLLPWIW